MKRIVQVFSFIALISLALAIGVFGSRYITIFKLEANKEVVNTSGESLIGGPFILTDQDGNIVTQEDLLGHWSIFFFGYTSCPDICPPTLQNITLALNQLGERGNKIIPYFISVDPWRDTKEIMAEYVSYFHPNLVGLNGTPQQIEAMTSAYRIFYSPKNKPTTKDYVVEHSSLLYLLGPDGRFVTHFNHSTSIEELAGKLANIL